MHAAVQSLLPHTVKENTIDNQPPTDLGTVLNGEIR
jgi:hypothetical protein